MGVMLRGEKKNRTESEDSRPSVPLGSLGSTYGGLVGKSKRDFGRGSSRYITFMNVMAGVRVDPSAFGLVDVTRGEAQNHVICGDVFFNGSSETPEELGFCAALVEPAENVFLNSFCIGYRLRREVDVEPLYLAYLFRGGVGRRLIRTLAQGATRYNLSKASLLRVEIPLPVGDEQRAIVTALSDVDALIESLEQLLAKKRQIKQGAMQELLTGKKRLPGFSGEWKAKTLGELFVFSGGLSASRDQLSHEGHCYLHYGDIHTSEKAFVDIRAEYQDIPKLNVPLSKISAGALLEDGDVVFVDASEDDDGTSKHVVVSNPDGRPFISGLHTIVAKSRGKELDHLYRRYCFQTAAVKSQFRFYAVGTKVSGVSKANIAKIDIPVPTLQEQAAIASILLDMDSELAVLETKLVKARRLKQGMMQELLTGRIRLV